MSAALTPRHTVKLEPEVYQALVRAQAQRQMETGLRYTLSDIVNHALDALPRRTMGRRQRRTS